MKYLVFAGNDGEEYGGWEDWVAFCHSMEECKEYFLKSQFEWCHIVEVGTWEVTRGRRPWNKERAIHDPIRWEDE